MISLLRFVRFAASSPEYSCGFMFMSQVHHPKVPPRLMTLQNIDDSAKYQWIDGTFLALIFTFVALSYRKNFRGKIELNLRFGKGEKTKHSESFTRFFAILINSSLKVF
jgi:hypothetical protein